MNYVYINSDRLSEYLFVIKLTDLYYWYGLIGVFHSLHTNGIQMQHHFQRIDLM